MSEETIKKETFQVSGDQLVKKVKELIHEGNVRRIIIADKNGKTIVELPLSVGVVGFLVAPALLVAGSLAALLTECTITVERN